MVCSRCLSSAQRRKTCRRHGYCAPPPPASTVLQCFLLHLAWFISPVFPNPHSYIIRYFERRSYPFLALTVPCSISGTSLLSCYKRNTNSQPRPAYLTWYNAIRKNLTY